MSELIPAGNSQTLFSAAEITVVAGSPKTLFIKPNASNMPAPAGVDFEIAHKGPTGNYHVIDVLNAGNISQKGMIIGAGTYAVRRLQSSASAGMDVEG